MKFFISSARWFAGLIMVVFIIACLPVITRAVETDPPKVTVSKLLASPDKYNLSSIIISGEVIGQPLLRSNGAWFHLLDDERTAIGIWADKSTVESLKYFGRYGIKGDRVILQGIFYNAHPDHGGDTCIELETILGHEPGYEESKEPVAQEKWFIAVLLGMICLILWAIDRKINKKDHD